MLSMHSLTASVLAQANRKRSSPLHRQERELQWAGSAGSAAAPRRLSCRNSVLKSSK